MIAKSNYRSNGDLLLGGDDEMPLFPSSLPRTNHSKHIDTDNISASTPLLSISSTNVQKNKRAKISILHLGYVSFIANIGFFLMGYDFGAMSWFLSNLESYSATCSVTTSTTTSTTDNITFITIDDTTATTSDACNYMQLVADSSYLIGFLAACAPIGVVISFVFLIVFGNNISKRDEIIIASFLFFFGALLESLSADADWNKLFALLLFITGRLIYGAGIAVTVHAVPVYISQTIPAEVRGLVGSTIELMVSLGVVISYIVGFSLQSYDKAWLYTLRVAYIISLFMLVFALFLPLPPAYMIRNLQFYTRQDVLEVMRFITPDADDEEVDILMKDWEMEKLFQKKWTAKWIMSRRKQQDDDNSKCSNSMKPTTSQRSSRDDRDTLMAVENSDDDKNGGRKDGNRITVSKVFDSAHTTAISESWSKDRQQIGMIDNDDDDDEEDEVEAAVSSSYQTNVMNNSNNNYTTINNNISNGHHKPDRPERTINHHHHHHCCCPGFCHTLTSALPLELSILLTDKKLRLCVLLVIVLECLNSFSGGGAILYFATDIFSSYCPLTDTSDCVVILGLCKVIPSVILLIIGEYVGRRVYLFYGLMSMTLSLIVVCIGIVYSWKYVITISIFMTVISYQVSFGVFLWVLLSELFPFFLRSTAFSVAFMTLYTCAILITFLFPILESYFGFIAVFGIFTAAGAVSVAVVYLFVPETQGSDMERTYRLVHSTGTASLTAVTTAFHSFYQFICSAMLFDKSTNHSSNNHNIDNDVTNKRMRRGSNHNDDDDGNHDYPLVIMKGCIDILRYYYCCCCHSRSSSHDDDIDSAVMHRRKTDEYAANTNNNRLTHRPSDPLLT